MRRRAMAAAARGRSIPLHSPRAAAARPGASVSSQAQAARRWAARPASGCTLARCGRRRRAGAARRGASARPRLAGTPRVSLRRTVRGARRRAPRERRREERRRPKGRQRARARRTRCSSARRGGGRGRAPRQCGPSCQQRAPPHSASYRRRGCSRRRSAPTRARQRSRELGAGARGSASRLARRADCGRRARLRTRSPRPPHSAQPHGSAGRWGARISRGRG
mmetsp:Transcript_20318/g.68739  ORF Transcript_20318/g.68739 Transcript_20318/m.68739 type:complete len:223 (-) Transcript_20318:1186-1854(-)